MYNRFDTIPPLPGFQVHGIFKVEYLKNGASYGHSSYSTLIWIPRVWQTYGRRDGQTSPVSIAS